MSDSVGNKVYSGLGEFAVINAVIGLVIGTIISVILIIIGINIFRKKKVYTEKVSSTVVKSVCSQVSGNDTVTYKCDLELEYTIDNKTYVASLSKTSNIKYEVGSKMEIYHEKGNPENASTNIDSNTAGYILLIVGVVIIAMVYLNYYLVRKYKGYAAISGGVSAASMIGRSFR
jgi:hypothetical protein